MGFQLTPVQKFGEWLPDKGPLNNPGVYSIRNVVPIGDDYTSIEEIHEETSALPGECLGVFAYIDSSGLPHTFAGTADKLFQLVDGDWSDVTRESGGYSTTDDNRWRFAQYGNFVVATNYNDVMQVFDMASSTNFDDLAGSPPRAKYLSVVNNFLMAVSTFDEVDGTRSFRVWWSGLDDITTWTPNVSTQADNQDTPGYGSCTAVVGSQNSAILFLTGGIFRLDYVGPAAIFTFTLSEPNKGTRVAGSVASYSNLVFYWGEDGFNIYNGVSSQPIGHEKIDEWFRQRCDFSNIHKMQTVVNPRRKQVMWAFPSVDGAGICDSILIYNWQANRFGFVEQFVEAIGATYTEAALTDDDTDELTDDPSNDSLTDSVSFMGGRTVLSVVNENHRAGSFSGPARDAEIITGEIRLNPTGRAYISSIVPVVDCENVQVELLTRDNQTAAPVSSGLVSMEETGEAGMYIDARYHRARIVISGPWNRAQGIQLAYRNTGR
ncbi:MAG: hypothetical protein J0I79_16475 [Mesorhizobium sp.]|uniref:hypothetical protein n=1 Tax=Mesorhizobium sp. TaxID=1871066 RepID=UPI001AC53A87|nr:hypothetical protein [Mesorhizobium sp.]MBN9219542.1 hypothetical protein [Mesorhizobium sp.]